MVDKLITNRDNDMSLFKDELPPASGRSGSSSKAKQPKLTASEKAVIRTETAGAILTAQRQGDAPETQVKAGLDALIEITPYAGQVVEEAQVLVPIDSDPYPFEQSADEMFRQQDRVERDAEVTVADQFKASYNLMYPSGDVFWGNFSEGYNAADPKFDYNAVRMDVEAEFPEESDKQYLREARNPQMLEDRLASLRKDRDYLTTVGAKGEGAAVAVTLAAGFVDVPGFIAGMGVGKVAQMGAAAVRASRVASVLAGRGVNVAARAGVYAAEGVAGNLLTTATLDAAGANVTHSDYVAAAAFGAGFGQLQFLSRGSSGYLRQEDPEVVPLPTVRQPVNPRVEDATIQAVRDEATLIAVARTPEPVPEFSVTRTGAPEPVTAKANRTTAPEMLATLHQSADPTVAAMSKRLSDLIGSDPVVVKQGPRVGNSFFSTGSQTIFLRENAEDWVKLHETAHALTADRLRFGRTMPDSTIGRLTTQLDGLLAQAKDRAVGNNKQFVQYHLGSTDEFIAGLYSGKSDFHDFLASIPVAEGKDTLLNTLVQTVRRILGMDAADTNMLSKAIGLSDNLIQQPLNLTVKHRVVNEGGFTRSELVHVRRMGKRDDEAAAIQDMEDAAVDSNLLMAAEAQRLAGPDASPEDVTAALRTVIRREVSAVRDTVLAPVPATDRMFANGIFQPDNELGPLGGGLAPTEEALMPLAVREAALVRAGVLPELIADPAKRSLLGELYARAEIWNRQNPLDPNRISVLNRVPWLRGTGNALAEAEHPIARWVAGVLLESPAGALGRRRTAAMTKAIKQRIYLERHAEYNDQFVVWRNRNGGHAFSEVAGSSHRQRFNREVYEEILARDPEAEPRPDRFVDPAVGLAADALEAGYSSMRVDAKRTGTIGAERLGDHSRGYIQRRLGVEWVRTAPAADRAAVVRVWADQMGAAWDDPTFALRIASNMMERARTQAMGGVTTPANISNPESASIIRDELRKEGIPADRIDLLMGRFARGGAGYTKKRLNLDLDATVSRADGTEFRLMDAYETDVSKLYREYAQRMSGEVALAQFGVPGEHGMQLIREALGYGGARGEGVPDPVLEAFDQVRAEMAGRPIPGTKYNKHLGNLRLLTAASRLGGQAVTQFAETANGIGVVGAAAAMRVISQMPRLIQDVRLGRANPLLDSLEVHGGPIGMESRIVVPLQDSDDIRVFGQDAVTYFDRIVRAGANAMPWASGMHHVQMAQTRGFTEEIVKKAMRYIREGKEDTALAGMGIDGALSARLRAELDNIAEFDERGVLTALDLNFANDMQAVAEFVQAVHRGASQIIQKQYIGETGKWAHDDLLRLLTQFRSFSIVSMEKQWTRQRADEGTAKAVGLLLGSMAFALPLHIARVNVNSVGRENREEYLEQQLSPGALGRATLNYVSLSGLSGDVLDTVNAVAFGGELSGVRTGRTDVLGQVPGLGYVASAGQAIAEQDLARMVKQLPGANLPYMLPFINSAQGE